MNLLRLLTCKLVSHPLFIISLLASSYSLAFAQQEDADVHTLSAFTVVGSEQEGYYSAAVLSGTRTQMDLKDVPQTINVVTSDLIDDLGAIKLEDALRYTPGVKQGADFEGQLNFRGFRDSIPRLNGIPTAFYSRWDSAVVDRLEVVKGPSAALYGSTGQAGGFLNIITKKPLFTTQREASFSVNSFDRTRATIDLTGALGDYSPSTDSGLAYRLIGVVQDGSNHGWRDYADGERTVIAPSILWRISPNTEITLETYYDNYDRTFDVLVQPYKAPDQSVAFFDEIEPEANLNGPDSYDNFEQKTYTLYVTHRVNESFSLRFMTSAVRMEQQFLRRQGFVETAVGSNELSTFGLYRSFRDDRDWHRLDAQWNSKGSWGSLMLLGGVQYSDDVAQATNSSDRTEDPFPLFSAQASNYEFNSLSIYNQTQGVDSYTQKTDANAVVNYTFPNDAFAVYGAYSTLLNGQDRGVNFLAGGTPENTPWVDTEDPDDLQAGFVWHVTPKINLYTLYGKDERINSRDDTGVLLPNLTQDIREVGVKFNLANNANGSISFFEIERGNLAQRDFATAGAPLTPSGNERSRGVELELYWNPIENLNVVAGYAHLDAIVAENIERPDLVGMPLDAVADNAFSIWTKYEFSEGSLDGFSAGLGVSYTGSFNPYGANSSSLRAFATVPSSTLLNATFGYTFPERDGRVLSLQATLSNITDETYFEATDFGAPFNAELSAKLRF